LKTNTLFFLVSIVQPKTNRPRNLGRGMSRPKKNTVASLLALSRALGIKGTPEIVAAIQAGDLDRLSQLLSSKDSEALAAALAQQGAQVSSKEEDDDGDDGADGDSGVENGGGRKLPNKVVTAGLGMIGLPPGVGPLGHGFSLTKEPKSDASRRPVSHDLNLTIKLEFG
jgi:hypothetical protein